LSYESLKSISSLFLARSYSYADIFLILLAPLSVFEY